MSKLEKLKKWLTLDEAAQHISKKNDETITVADLYRTALDGYLKLSVYFVNSAYGVKGELCKVADIENQFQQQDFDIKDSAVHEIKGIWDLTMQGREALEVKGYFEQINSGLEVTTVSKNGILLQQDGATCQLYKYFDRARIFNPEFNKSEERRRAIAEEPMRIFENDPLIISPLIRRCEYGTEFIPCNKLSEEDCVLIIRKSEITRFIESLEDTPQEAKPLMPRERNTLLSVIEALLKKQGIDPSGKGVTSAIALILEEQGVYLSDNTIRKITRQITDITA